ncbi:PHD and RING finger domain-containing protein 1-like isoform X2 [Planococcus citri]|uniref:PHD and RING finger domain-containing protein 1-like isoform X2 n=1 Tax=Planococcus citri TaxID=170843 RepID=UPI0031F79928
MLRNRSKISQNNRRNARKRNRRNADEPDESSSSSNEFDSSQQDCSSEIPFDDSSDSWLEDDDDDDVSPVIGRNLKIRRNRLNAKSKRSNKVINNRNRNSRSKRNSHRSSDSHAAGPSRVNNNSRRSRSENSNARTAKRKFKDRREDSDSSLSEVCNTSSEEFDAPLFRLKKKRPRHAINFSESEDSDVQTITSRRQTLVDSESSTSTSDDIITAGRIRRNAGVVPSWSDSSADSIELNSQETSTVESSGSSSFIVSRRNRSNRSVGYVGTSDSSSSSSSFSSSFGVDSEVANITSVLDSEASSSYNTAPSVSSSNVENTNKDQTSDSDSSDSDGEKCAICLKKFRNQLIGNPSNCEHNFCAPCLKKWSESSTTCPVDRSTFDFITIRSEINGPVVDKFKVENRNFGVFPPLDIDEEFLTDAINCEICGSGDDEETLLLCDFCNLGYHMACLRPPLSAIPAGAWYCPPCVDLHSTPAQNVNEAFRFLPNIAAGGPFFFLSSARRPNRIGINSSRSRLGGPLPRGRGPTRGFRSQNLSNSRLQNLSNVIESVMANLNVESTLQNRRRRKRRNGRATSANALQQVTTSENLVTTSDAKSRITRVVNQRMSSSSGIPNIPRPRGPRDVVDMVFPSFSLFGGDDLDYFSDGPDEHDVDGEVAIMARVRNEYSARRLGNRKNIVASLNNYHDRGAAAASIDEITANASSANLLDSILESQTLWHSKNVEIKSKKDGTLEIKRKDERKPDLTNTNHSSKEIPLFPNKGDGASDNKSYSSSNNRYSSLGNSSGGGSNSFTSSTSSFNSLNPSIRPGFSNLLGNSSSALDLSPFRGAAPIRFRMNPPRPMMRRQNYNSNSQRQPSSSPASLSNSVQSPKKSSTVGNAEEDVDLYDDIETENAENEKAQEIFGSLEPPPEPPALLIGNDSSSSDDENNGLVIDDKAVNKNNIYDPNEPNEDSDTENNQDKNSNLVPSYLRSPSYGGLSEFGPHLPLPEPPALPIELDSVKDSDEEEEAECPNMTLYSSTSINLANNVQDIPIPDAAYPQDELECIPIPTPAVKEDTTTTNTDSKLYSPTDRNDSETSSLADVEISSPRKVLPKRRDTSEIRSVSSRGSSREPSDRSSADESDRSDRYENIKKRSSRRRSKENNRTRRRSSVNNASIIDPERVKPSKEIDLTEIDSNDEKEPIQSDDESVSDSKADAEEIDDKYDVSAVAVDENDENEAEKSDNDEEAEEKSPIDAASTKSVNEDDKSDSEDGDKEREKDAVDEADKEKPIEDAGVDTSLEAEVAEKAPEDDSANASANDANVSGNYLLPSEDLDPVSDVEYNDFSECPKSSSIRDKRKKRKKTRRRDSSTDNKTAAEAKELEEGEIEEEKSKRKYSSQKKKGRSVTPERSPDRRLKKRRDRKEKTTGKENKESGAGGKTAGGAGGTSAEDLRWKKLSKNTKERNYRDGKPRPNDKTDKVRDREIKSRKEKRKEIERYDVRKIVSDKPPRPVRDEFGRDVSANRSRSRTRTRSLSYSGRKRSKGGTTRRSFSQDDRWIDWSPVWNQRRSRSRTRRTRSRSRNRSRLSGDRYRNRSKNRDREREYDKREPRKRKRSVSSDINKYTPPQAELKKRRRSRDRSRKSESYAAAALRPSDRERDIPPEYYYERSRSWSRTLSYASLTPEPEQYVRYSRSPSIIEQPTRMPLVSPDRERGIIAQNPQNLTVIVPNVDLSKKKHKKKKESKKKKKKQPSKEVFTSGDNIVVSVNFDDNQKIISAKSSKRKHDDEKGRKRKEIRKKRKQTLQVSDEVLNAKPVAVIDLNSSPCKEMSPTEVISLTDSGDEANVIIESVVPADRRIVTSQEDANKSPNERRAYVMTQSGPKTPPEPPIKFTLNSTAPNRPLATNPIFEQDEIDGEDAMHYNKGPNTPPEPAGQTRRSISPSTTMYDPFEPTKSRSQSPENTQYDERKDTSGGVTAEERRPVIDMFSDDGDKPVGESQGSGASAEKSKSQEDIVKETSSSVTPTKSSIADDVAPSTNTKSPAKDASASDSAKANETTQSNGVNTLVLDLSSLGDDFVPKSSIPLVKTSQGKYEFQSGKAPDKPITVVISQQSQPVKPQPQQVMVTPTRQIPPKPVEPMKQPIFPDLLSWKLPPPMSQTNFSTPPPTSSLLPPGILITPSKSAPGMLAQNGNQDESSFEIDDSPYSPASSEGDDLFEPPPLNASTASPNKQRPSPMPAVNSFKSRVDALFSSSPMKKAPPRGNVPPHISKPVSAIKGTKKILKPPPPIPSSKKDIGSKADEEQLKILDDVPNSAVEMMVKEKFLKKLHRQERVVEEVKVVLKPHYAKKHITKEEYKDILRKAVPKICHNKSGDINPSKIQGLVEAYVKKTRYAKKKPTMGAGAPLFPPMKTAGKTKKPPYSPLRKE